LNSLDISLICSRETAKDGKKLVELAYQKAKELNIRYLSLLSINNDKVLKWYKAQGFILTSETRNVDGTIKAYYMVKPIT
jgi:ribosomal protein S18 acetylase RimI-like enzyme